MNLSSLFKSRSLIINVVVIVAMMTYVVIYYDFDLWVKISSVNE